ncbi:MAG TPA: ABC transporter substrate-binding protein [Cellvibrio sp.]|nr:ABC transporter substrate-binding protein [Cellvibrio sp.]
MMKTAFLLKSLFGLSLSIALVWSQFSSAQAPAGEPKVIVEAVAQELFGLVKTKNANKTPDDQYYKQVEKVMDPVVNFPFIAGSVMGKATYKQATPAQREQFLKVFKDGMVKSLAKGILGYADSKVVIAGVDTVNPTRVVVKQEVSAEGNTHKLDYTMVKGKSGEWKLINVVLNGVNLGQSFSSQFKAGLKKHNNNVDQVIANWLVDA